MLDNYFKDLFNIYKVFNTTFYDKYYLIHAPHYVSKPTEIINKLLDIIYTLDPESSLLHRAIQKLIINKIEMGITTTINQIYIIIYEEYNQLIETIYDSECCVNGYNRANVEIIKKNLEKFKSYYVDENNKFIRTYTYSIKHEDEFNLRNIIVDKTNEIIINLRRIVDQINIDFHHTFCYGVQIECLFIESVGQIEHFYYQASKLRVSLSFIQTLVTIAQSMITKEKILIDLSAEEYYQLFSLELNYKETEILTDIKTFIRQLNEETKEYISESITNLKTHIKAYFVSGANIETIKKNIESIAQSVFVSPEDFLLEIQYYIYYACGPVSKIILSFNEEINFHKYLSKNKFEFNLKTYKSAYEAAFNRIVYEYSNKIDKMFDYWKIPDLIIKDLKKVINDALDEYYTQINENVNTLTDITKFEFLDMEYSVKDIAKEALNEAKNEITSQLDKIINEIYNNYLDKLKRYTKEFVKQQFATIKNALNSEYQSAVSYYTHYHNDWDKNQSVNYNYTITFQDTTEKQLNDAVKIFFEKIESVYNQQALNEVFIKSQEIALQKYYFKFTFEDFTSYIKNDIYQITNIAYERLRIEKSKFQSQIKIFYENAFRIIFSQFVNGKGKDYLNFAVNFDYENNIYHDFTLMRTAINQTYYILSTLLQEPTVTGLGYTISQILEFNYLLKHLKMEIIKLEKILILKLLI